MEEHQHGKHCGCGHELHHEQPHSSAPAGMVQRIYPLENLGCAHCAARMEEKIRALPGVASAAIVFATKQLRVTAPDPDALLPRIRKICTDIESQVVVTAQPEKGTSHDHPHSGRQWLELVLGGGLFLLGILVPLGWLKLTAFVAGYLVLGGSVLQALCILLYVLYYPNKNEKASRLLIFCIQKFWRKKSVFWHAQRFLRKGSDKSKRNGKTSF